MAARKLPRDGEPNPLSVRLSAETLDGLDAWLEDMNRSRAAPMNRTDLIRGVLAWAARNRPEWEEPRFVIELWKDGKRLSRQGVQHPPGGVATFIFEDNTSISGHLTETRIDGEQVVMVYSAAPAGKPPAIRIGK